MSLNKFGRSSLPSSHNIRQHFSVGGVLLKYTSDGNISADNLKIANLKEPTSDRDAVNKKYIDDKAQYLENNVHTLKSLLDNNINRLTSISSALEEYAAKFINIDNVRAQDLRDIEVAYYKLDKKFDEKLAQQINQQEDATSNAILEVILNIDKKLNEHYVKISEEIKDRDVQFENNINILSSEVKSLSKTIDADIKKYVNEEIQKRFSHNV